MYPETPLPPGDSLSDGGTNLLSPLQPRGDPRLSALPIDTGGGGKESPPARQWSGSEPARPRGWTPRAKGLARPADVDSCVPLAGYSDGLVSRCPLPGHRRAGPAPYRDAPWTLPPHTWLVWG
jgi:hypothetical protein